MITVPNAVSLVRLLAVPLVWWLTLGRRELVWAAVVIVAVGATDWVDGYLARRLGQVSEVGKFLDPLADRLVVASALLAGLLVQAVPLVIGLPLLVREVVVGGGAVILSLRGGANLEVRYLGKVATFLLYGALPAFYLLSAGVATWLFGPPAWIAGVVGLALYYWVGFEYVGDARRALVGGRGAGPVSSGGQP